MTLVWPLTGRGAELAELREKIAVGRSVIVAGPAGIGKSRLLDEALVEPSGACVVRVAATAAVVGIPLGVFGTVLPLQQSGANLLSWAVHGIVEHARGEKLLLVVDDLHLLDPTSAAVVYQLVFGESAGLVGTLRSGEAAPDAVVGLWKDGMAERIELVPLSRGQVMELAEAVLGSSVDEATADRLWSLSEGLPLLLRELLLGGLAEGTLRQANDRWRWDGPAPTHPRLAELIDQRLRGLDRNERRALELVALGEPLELPALVHHAEEALAESLEEKALIRIHRSDRRLHAVAGHPLYAEMARARMPELRRRRLYRELADAVEVTGARRREDAMRITLWRLDAGIDQPADPLLAACRLAWAAQDFLLAERLALAALAAGAGTDAVAALVEVLIYSERWAEIGDLIRPVLDQPLEPHERALFSARLAFVLGYGDGELHAAIDMLDAVDMELSDHTARHTIALQRISFFVDSGQFVAGAAACEQLLSSTDTSAAQRADALSALAFCLAMTGRTSEAVAAAESCWAQRASWRETVPWVTWQLGYTRARAGELDGDLNAAESALEWQRGEKADLISFAGAYLQLEEAAILRLRGRPASALSVARTEKAGVSLVDGLISAEAAHSAALLNDLPLARTLRERAVVKPDWYWVSPAVDVADVWLAAQSGLMTEAVHRCVDLAERAAKLRSIGVEMLARHDLVRLDAAEKAVDRLAEIATIHDGRLAPVIAAHAAAAVASDAAGLLEVANRFENFGMTLFAAEAAAQAARAHASAGRTRAATAATTRALRLAEQCEGARTPALIGVQAPQLSRREYEIGRLAACGHSNKEIAAKLYVSLRTVENHLHSVFSKLGIIRRDELTELLR